MSQITESDAWPFKNSDTTDRAIPPNPVVRRKAVPPGNLYGRENKKGLVIIFNHFEIFPRERKKSQPVPRHGTEVDVENLMDCFKGLNFEVKDYNELSHRRILRILNDVAQQDHANTSCVAVVLMTHGDSDGKVLAADTKYSVSDLWQQFEQARNPTLHGKPKLFFIQACRGDKTDEGDVVTDAAGSVDAPIKIPTRADYLIMYSTVEDTAAFRDKEGSWFISALCHQIRHHAARDLLEILTAVNHYIAYVRYTYHPYDDSMYDKKQMPQIVSMLTKHLFFD